MMPFRKENVENKVLNTPIFLRMSFSSIVVFNLK